MKTQSFRTQFDEPDGGLTNRFWSEQSFDGSVTVLNKVLQGSNAGSAVAFLGRSGTGIQRVEIQHAGAQASDYASVFVGCSNDGGSFYEIRVYNSTSQTFRIIDRDSGSVLASLNSTAKGIGTLTALYDGRWILVFHDGVLVLTYDNDEDGYEHGGQYVGCGIGVASAGVIYSFECEFTEVNSTTKTLSIGSSLTHDAIVTGAISDLQGIASGMGKAIDTDWSIVYSTGASNFYRNLETPPDLSQPSGMTIAQLASRNVRYDYLTILSAAATGNTGSSELDAIVALAEMTRGSYGFLAIQETFPEVSSIADEEEWLEFVQGDYTNFSSQPEHRLEYYRELRRAVSVELGFEVGLVPILQVMERLVSEEGFTVGTDGNGSTATDVYRDNVHASQLGRLIGSITFATYLTGYDPRVLTLSTVNAVVDNSTGHITQERIDAIARVAYEVVLESGMGLNLAQPNGSLTVGQQLQNCDSALSAIASNLGALPAALLSAAIPSTGNAANTMADCLNAARAQGFGKWTIDETAKTLTMYADDGTTVVKQFTIAPDTTIPISRTPVS